jgi:hypothetical protein
MGLIARFLAKRADRAIADWRREMVRPAPGASITAARVYGSYHEWCRDNRRRWDPGRLRLVPFRREKRGKRLYYCDIAIRETA